MPTFCRHNRLIQNCPICSREQSIELRPVISSSAPRVSQPRAPAPGAPRGRTAAPGRPAGARGAGGGLRVRRLARGTDDGYRSALVPGLKSSEEADRLAEEIAFAGWRLTVLELTPPGTYAEVADRAADIEERTWLAFLIAYLCPLEEDDPFSEIERVRTPWASGELPALEDVRTGPRTAHESARGQRTLEAYRTWARRFGTQAAAFAGEPGWTPERRFARIYERLALPGLHREARFELLVSLGRLGVYDLRAGSLALGGPGQVTIAAKRALGIGDPLLLERRAAELAQACGVPLEALDAGLHNWERGERMTLGLGPGTEPDPDAAAAARAALGVQP